MTASLRLSQAPPSQGLGGVSGGVEHQQTSQKKHKKQIRNNTNKVEFLQPVGRGHSHGQPSTCSSSCCPSTEKNHKGKLAERKKNGSAQAAGITAAVGHLKGVKRDVGQLELSSPSTTSTCWENSSESSDTASPVSRVSEKDLKGFKGDEQKLASIVEVREILQQNNPYLNTGWRLCGTPRECVRSLFQLHNETLNIWTHALPAIYFIYLCFRHIFIDIPNGEPFAGVILVSSLASAILFVCSASYHTFRCMSPAALWSWLRVDYCGICTQIIGAALPALHLGFMCAVALRNLYVTISSLLLFAALGISSGMMPTRVQQKCCQMCNTDDWSVVSMKVLAFSTGLTGIPFVQWAVTTSSVEFWTFGPPIVLMFIFYGGGFVLFTQLIPERFGYFWLKGALNSHSIWHACVVAAAVVMHNNTIEYANWRAQNPCVV